MVRHTGFRLFEMLKNDVMTDVTFNVQGTEVKGHRNVVSSHGGILRELLEAKAAEQVEIEDVAPHTFNTVLEYLYTDKCSISELNVFELMHASKMLGLSDLEKCCAETMKGKLTMKNVGAFAAEALQFESKEYLQVCEDYFRTHTYDVIKTKEFLEVSNDVLAVLCSSESIGCSELDLFLACVAWAQSECKRKNLQISPENLRNRTDIVEVTVRGYRWDLDTIKDSKLSVPLSTTVSQLKAMNIFRGGTNKRPADKFTLEHEGRELSDNVTLASIHNPGQDLILQFHSFTQTVKDSKGRWEFPLTMKPEDIKDRYVKVIEGHLYSYKDINPNKVSISRSHSFRIPGGTYNVDVMD